MLVPGGSVGWVVIGLCFGTSVLAETDAGFCTCGQSFYKQAPPVGFSGGQLQARCHSLGTGRSFASLYSTSCDITVLSAFRLHKTWGGSQGDVVVEEDTGDAQTGTEEQDESQTDEKDVPATTPVLLRRDGYNIHASPDTPADSWDALLSELVRNTVHPQCGSLGGDLYVLTGRGSVGELGQGCELGLFWSAMCCVVPDEVSVFSVGIVKAGEEVRVLDVKGLEQVVGVESAFFGGCGEAGGGGGGGIVTLSLFQCALQQVIQMHNTDTHTTLAASSDTLAESATLAASSDTLAESATLAASSDTLAESATLAASSDTVAESATLAASSDTVAESTTLAASSDMLTEGATQAASSDMLTESAQADSSDTQTESYTQPVEVLAESSLAKRAATQRKGAEGGSCALSPHKAQDTRATASHVSEKPRAEPRGNSTLRYLLSCSLWLLYTPIRPVASTLTQLPGQVTHVIREDLAVLSTLPGCTFSLVYNVVGDSALGALSAASLAGRAGAAGASRAYSCTSTLVGTLLSTCQDGVTGMGTLTSDGVGIFGGGVNRAWSVSKYFGGRAWEQSKGFLWAVLRELGIQSKSVGGGLGKLVWNGGKGVVNTVYVAWRIVAGVVTVAADTFGEA